MLISDWSSDVFSSYLARFSRISVRNELVGLPARISAAALCGWHILGVGGPVHRRGDSGRGSKDHVRADLRDCGDCPCGRPGWTSQCLVLMDRSAWGSHLLHLSSSLSDEPTSDLQSLMRISYAV